MKELDPDPAKDDGPDAGELRPDPAGRSEGPSLDLGSDPVIDPTRDARPCSKLSLKPGLDIPPPALGAEVNEPSMLDRDVGAIPGLDPSESTLRLECSKLNLFLVSGLTPDRMIPPAPEVCEDAADCFDLDFPGSRPCWASNSLKFALLNARVIGLPASGTCESPATRSCAIWRCTSSSSRERLQGCVARGGRGRGFPAFVFDQDSPSKCQKIPFPNPPGGPSWYAAGKLSGG